MAETRCISCGAAPLAPILHLGTTPLANALLTKEQIGKPEPRFPLELRFCATCSLVQITEKVPPEQMFREYAYFSSFSDTIVSQAGARSRRTARSSRSSTRSTRRASGSGSD